MASKRVAKGNRGSEMINIQIYFFRLTCLLFTQRFHYLFSQGGRKGHDGLRASKMCQFGEKKPGLFSKFDRSATHVSAEPIDVIRAYAIPSRGDIPSISMTYTGALYLRDVNRQDSLFDGYLHSVVRAGQRPMSETRRTKYVISSPTFFSLALSLISLESFFLSFFNSQFFLNK